MGRATVAAVLWLVTGAAGAGPPAPHVASCHDGAGGRCYEYVDVDQGLLAITETSCRAMHATWNDARSCPTERRIAHCRRADRGAVEGISFYPPATLKDARAECASGDMNVERE